MAVDESFQKQQPWTRSGPERKELRRYLGVRPVVLLITGTTIAYTAPFVNFFIGFDDWVYVTGNTNEQITL